MEHLNRDLRARIAAEKASISNSKEGLHTPKPLHKRYTRRDLSPYLGITVNSFPTKVQKIAEHIAEIKGLSEVPTFGNKGLESGKWEYTYNEAIELIEGYLSLYPKKATEGGDYEDVSPCHNPEAWFLNIANQKGGVGKSTVGVYVAQGLATMGLKRRRVLIIDGDSQGSLKNFFDDSRLPYEAPTLAKYLRGDFDHEFNPECDESRTEWIFENLIRDSQFVNLQYIPSLTNDNNFDTFLNKLEDLHESDIDDDMDEELLKNKKYFGQNVFTLLYDKLFRLIKHHFDYVIYDSAPHNNRFTHCALYCAHHIISPTMCNALARDSTLEFWDNTTELVMLFKKLFNKPIPKGELLITHHKNNKEDQNKIYGQYRRVFTSEMINNNKINNVDLFSKLQSRYETIYSHAKPNDISSYQHVEASFDSIIDGIITNAKDHFHAVGQEC